MKSKALRGTYRRLCRTSAVLRRYTKGPGTPPTMIPFSCDVKCRIWTWGNWPRDLELVQNKKQSEYVALIPAEWLEKAQWPGGVLPGDKLIVGSKVYTVETADKLTRVAEDTLAGYELTLKG